MSTRETEVAVIGSGIVGLSQALAFAKRGRSVTVFDRSAKPEGASVRNFGMIWPIGVPAGPLHQAALLTREILLDLAPRANFWLDACGSIHLARAEDEAAVFEQFLSTPQAKPAGCRILTPDEVLSKSPFVRVEGLRCGLFSPLEMAVDPRELIAKLWAYLESAFDVRFEFNATVVGIESPHLHTADNRHWRFERAIVCGGADFQTLFPGIFASSGVRRCKLQMMRTFPQPGNKRMGPHIAGGGSLRHYKSFAGCPSVESVRARIAVESPELDRFGIHVMASQNALGEIVIGDSHEFDDEITPFDKAEIDGIILEHLTRMLKLPDPRIAQRWHGIYPRHSSLAQFACSPQDDVQIVLNTNGLGMTLSLGLAELTTESSIHSVPSSYQV